METKYRTSNHEYRMMKWKSYFIIRYSTFVIHYLLLCFFTYSASSQPQPTPSWQWIPQVSDTPASLRGLSVVNASVAWTSGSQGTVLRTTDGGASWQTLPIPDTDSVDFRDIAAFDAQTAYVLSAGEPALIYKTTDSGTTWQRQHYDTTAGIFYDAFAFWNSQHGIAMSDPIQEGPVDSCFVLIRTTDGEHWKPIPQEQIPAPVAGEAGFAASGTGLVVQGDRHVWFATGGGAARVFRSADRGQHWQTTETPMIQGQPSTGIFSLAFQDTLRGVAVGGDYAQPEQEVDNACFTTDGGSTWQLATTPPRGYRSGVAYLATQDIWVAVGPTGSDYSADGGQTWMPLDTVGYHAIQFAPDGSAGWATGAEGSVVKITPK